jgi:hypothetical protein
LSFYELQLVEGTAEIFGAELHRGVSVNVAGQKLAVITLNCPDALIALK